MMIHTQKILFILAFCAMTSANIHHLDRKLTRQLTLGTSAHARLFQLRGGGKRKNKRIKADSESESDEEDEGMSHIKPNYKPNKKGLVASLFTLLLDYFSPS